MLINIKSCYSKFIDRCCFLDSWCVRLFKEAVEDKKHSIPLLIGAAISMVSIVTIPWAVRRFKERRLQDKLETSLEKFV